MFDLSGVAAMHQRVVMVMPTKSVLHGGMSADAIFPVQVRNLSVLWICSTYVVGR